jgi:hypothetical protein
VRTPAALAPAIVMFNQESGIIPVTQFPPVIQYLQTPVKTMLKSAPRYPKEVSRRILT